MEKLQWILTSSFFAGAPVLGLLGAVGVNCDRIVDLPEINQHNVWLGGGFKKKIFSALLGEMIQFD